MASKRRQAALKQIEKYKANGGFTPLPYKTVKTTWPKVFPYDKADYVDPRDYAGFGAHCRFDPMERGDIVLLEFARRELIVERDNKSDKYSGKYIEYSEFIVAECIKTGLRRTFRALDSGHEYQTSGGKVYGYTLYRIPYARQFAARCAAGTYNTREGFEAWI